MDILLKAIACALVGVVLYHTIAKDRTEISVLLSIAVICVVLLTTVSFTKPILEFIRKVESLGKLNSEMVSIMIKSVGIGFLTEITTLVCKDMGNSSMGKAIQILATTVVVWMSLPVFQSLFSLIEAVFSTL